MELRFDNDADRDDPVVRAFLARIPEAQRMHAARGLTDEESWQTLQDLARHARLDRLLYGTPGLRKRWWVELAFSGRLFALGRLQFEPTDGGFLNIHIPEEGPLTPAAVDASLARACELFPEYPEARCSSWLLDPQLAGLLPSGSNILSFQRRFEPIADEGVEPRVLEYVFHAFEPDLERLPRDTTLQRALVDHLRGGGQLHRVTGTLGL